jgi:RocCOR-like putative regulator of kinase activity/DAPkinase-like Roc (Ras of Complex) protein/Leucine Rich Repeat (LRR) protein
MARRDDYRQAEKKIEEARRSGATELHLMGLTELPESLDQLTELQSLNLSSNQLETLPEWLGKLTNLQSLDLSFNRLKSLPEDLSQLKQLQFLNLYGNQISSLPGWFEKLKHLRSLYLGRLPLTQFPSSLHGLTNLVHLHIWETQIETIPDWIGNLCLLEDLGLNNNKLSYLPNSLTLLKNLQFLKLSDNQLGEIPDWIGEITLLRSLELSRSELFDLPASLAQLEHLERLELRDNPLNPELAAAYGEGVDAVKRYLRAKAESQVALDEAKLILVGEGEVGKSCLLGALRGEEWIEDRPTTHGIEIKPFRVINPNTGTEITLNAWDFGGQRVYRPTHQLFFSAPAVYLVVWKPREGPQQGFVKEWIKLVKHREPDAKILVVATHGGPGQRQPDVDRQEIWDLFGRDTVQDFFLVDSKPGEKTGERLGIAKLKEAIARVAAGLPEMGRQVPARWQQVREALQETGAAYLPLDRVLDICREHKMDETEARLFVSISHRLGHLIHYEHDPTLRDIVVLKPDWLATAMSFVLDDKQTRDAHGLVSFSRLEQLWNDPEREEEFRYPPELHPVFLRLMERFDLSYRVAGLSDDSHTLGTSLIAQLVPDVRPEPIPGWAVDVAEGDEQKVQICRILDSKTGQSAAAEGLFYQLIVRLHKYSLGRMNHKESVHWQRGLELDDDYNGRALLEHIGNDIRISVRAPYPEGFLAVLTREVKWLVETFWTGLRCDVMVPCQEPCGKDAPGTGLFEVQKLIESKRHRRPEYPCPVCNEWQSIDFLLRNAPAVQRTPVEDVLAGLAAVKGELGGVRQLLIVQHGESLGRFDKLDIGTQRILSQGSDTFTRLMQALIDEAKDGPRLFSFQPGEPGFFDRPKWLSQKFRLTLWCEHSRLPLPSLNGKGDRRGVYDLNLPREWFVKAAPFFKVLTGTLSLVLPIASSATKLVLDDASYKGIEKELDLGQKSVDSVLKGGEKVGGWLGGGDTADLERGEAVQAQGGILRELHALLKEKDPSFGGLVRVRNKRQEFLWVHPQFEKEY